MSDQHVDFEVRGKLTDVELSSLHARAFGGGDAVEAWNDRLERFSLTWVTGRCGEELVAFVNVLGDGGAHAILMDTAVAPEVQGRGVGTRLVEIAADHARALGCQWLHADYEPHLVDFYEGACGMRPTNAGLLRL